MFRFAVKYFPFPLRFTVPLILFLLGGIVSAFAVYQQLERTQQQAKETAIRRAEFSGTKLSTLLDYVYRSAKTSKVELEGANLIVSQLNEDDHLRYAFLFDEANRVIFANRYEYRYKHISDSPITSLLEQVQQQRRSRSGRVFYDETSRTLHAIYPIQLQPLANELRASRVGVLVLQYELSEVLNLAFQNALKQSIPTSGVLLLLCLAIWFLFERIVTHRAALLVKASHGLAEGKLHNRVSLNGCDELVQIGVAFNQMAARIQQDTETLQASESQLKQKTQQLEKTLEELQSTQTQLIQTEKMSSLGQMVAGVAHEINNPVGFISGNIAYTRQYIEELLRIIQLYQVRYPQPVEEIDAAIADANLEFIAEDALKMLQSMEVGAERIHQIVLSLRTFSRLDEADMKAVDIHDGIESTLMILQSRIKGNHQRSEIAVIRNYGEFPKIECYAGQLNQVFLNILNNAIDAIDERTKHQKSLLYKITIDTNWKGENTITIRFTDNGGGIPEAIQSRIFDPFFTTKPVGKGTGLGLSIAYQIVTEKHQGNLTCQSEPGGGTTFSIEIPIMQNSVACAGQRQQVQSVSV